jgi:hypothetical protein
VHGQALIQNFTQAPAYGSQEIHPLPKLLMRGVRPANATAITNTDEGLFLFKLQ